MAVVQRPAAVKTTPNRKELTMFRLTLRYARYALATLTTIGFGLSTN